MDRSGVEEWVAGYVQMWRTAGTDRLGELFAPDAIYQASPWARTMKGLDRLARFWERERDGPDEEFTLVSEVVAVDGDTAVVRVSVDYLGGRPSRWRDLWILRFGPDGRCSAFEEWPFAPKRRDGHEPLE